jgi:hypothetical protein
MTTIKMTTLKIQRIKVETSTGRVAAAWSVVDASDGYVFDTFDRRCDAADWMRLAQDDDRIGCGK